MYKSMKGKAPERADDEEKQEGEEEEWDCRFTDTVVAEYTRKHAEGDPVKVNEYLIKEALGAGGYASMDGRVDGWMGGSMDA